MRGLSEKLNLIYWKRESELGFLLEISKEIKLTEAGV
jgi:hypothetical protein